MPRGERKQKNLPVSFYSLHGFVSGGDTIGSFEAPKMFVHLRLARPFL